MTDIPEPAIEAALGAKTEDLPETVQYAMIRGLAAMGFAQPSLASWDIIEAAIKAALPHLDGYAAGFAAGQEAVQDEALKAAREVLRYLRDKTALDDLDRLAIAGALAKIDALTGGEVE